ncbi:hypothetical protein DM02DRAFT_652435 [Periconia macrospinosa]|uniref:Uncharacterized protein n=1 Tax=Periconia macrospinosa TaxID=97972 RepID=A0A2V1E1Y4_9PLEO|nr:hypothetical protein DM02DRAFT_652435 [Periconia macrospinosa]
MFAVAYGLWKQPIDANIFGIQANYQGQLRIPFACHVRYPISTVPLDVSFHQFAQLPAELQLRVLQFCDKPTLFRLMQTSSFIRREAMKLFFADPETWYCVDGDWLKEGGHPTDGIHDIDFLRRIERLSIELSSITAPQWKDEHIRNLWRRVQCLFPLAKYVMLVDTYRNYSEDRHLKNWSIASGPSQPEKRFCQLCPQNISVFLSILHGPFYGRLERSLWRRVSIQEDSNETQELDQCESHPGPSIIVPHKPFRGRVGTLLKIREEGWAITDQQTALEVFQNAAVERHHFHERHEPFGCPAPDCDAWFERPEEYTTHMATSPLTHPKIVSVPEPYQSLFTDAKKRLEQQELLHVERLESYVQWIGEWGSEQQKLAEKELLHELEQDSLHVQEETLIFTRMWFDHMYPWQCVESTKEYIQEVKTRAKSE